MNEKKKIIDYFTKHLKYISGLGYITEQFYLKLNKKLDKMNKKKLSEKYINKYIMDVKMYLFKSDNVSKKLIDELIKKLKLYVYDLLYRETDNFIRLVREFMLKPLGYDCE